MHDGENGNFDWAELGEEVHAFINKPREADRYLSLKEQKPEIHPTPSDLSEHRVHP